MLLFVVSQAHILCRCCISILTANPTPRANGDKTIKVVLDESDPLNACNALLKLRSMTPDTAVFVFNHRLTDNQIKANTSIGFPDWRFNPERRMGKNTIGKLVPELAFVAGIKDWRKKTNHTLRAFAITKMANAGMNSRQVSGLVAIFCKMLPWRLCIISPRHWF